MRNLLRFKEHKSNFFRGSFQICHVLGKCAGKFKVKSREGMSISRMFISGSFQCPIKGFV